MIILLSTENPNIFPSGKIQGQMEVGMDRKHMIAETMSRAHGWFSLVFVLDCVGTSC